MKLRKFRTLEEKVILGLKIFCCILILTIILMGKSLAEYKQEVEVPFIRARVGKFKTNDIQLAMLLDGEEVETPPSKDNYTVDISCDNADGSWDSDRWGANIDNIRAGKVKCEVNFATPVPTMSEITVSFSKTSINLGYTISGINTHATCKYGTEEGNYSTTVEEVTSTNCNITGLEEKITYYYQVCAVNGGGEDCKTGNVKTGATVLDLNIGDYVNMTPTSTSYTIATSTTGYTSTQTINPSELNLWRVIRKNSDGTVDMVSEYVSSKKVYFQGKEGYINFVGGLNTIAAQYTDGVHVASTRHIGYSNQTQTITDTSMISRTSAPWAKDTNTGWTATSSGFTEAEETQGAGDIGYTTDYQLVNAVYGNMIGRNPSGAATSYWLASRSYSLYTYKEYIYWYFRGRLVGSDGYLNVAGTLYQKETSYVPGMASYAIRPVITIKADTRIVSGDGKSAETAYQLG